MTARPSPVSVAPAFFGSMLHFFPTIREYYGIAEGLRPKLINISLDAFFNFGVATIRRCLGRVQATYANRLYSFSGFSNQCSKCPPLDCLFGAETRSVAS